MTMARWLVTFALTTALINPGLMAKPARKGAAKPAVVSRVSEASPASLYLASSGCPSAPAGKFAAAPVDKKVRGKSPIELAPRIATVEAVDLCGRRTKLDSAAGNLGIAALGLSAQVPNTLAGRQDLLAIPEVETQFQKVLLRYSQAWPYAKPPKLPRVLFRATDGYEAYSLADGTIVMSLGLVESAESDSELLFVLAHEYGHVLMGHHAAINEGGGGGMKALFGTLGTIYTATTLVSQLRNNNGNLGLADRGKVESAAKRASVLSEALSFAVDDLWAPNYSRNQEYEADAIAMDLLIGSNQTIDSYSNVFARLGKLFDKRAVSREKSEARANALNKSLGETVKELSSPEFLKSVGMGDARNMRRLGTDMLFSFGAKMIMGSGKAPGDTHPPPEERRKALAGYFQAGYPKADPPIDAGVMLGLVKGMGDYKRAVVMRDGYLKARTAYDSQNFDGALTGLKALGAGNRASPTFINYFAGLAARDKGDIPSAASYFEAGRTGSGIPSAMLQEKYVELDIGKKDYVGARALLDDANARFRDPDHFRSVEIARLAAAGDLAGAKANFTECQQIKGRDYIPARCKAAYPGEPTAAAEPGAKTSPLKKIKIPGLGSPF